ncbi:DUF1816 domain-containing protein [Synechococcus sp. CBW1107]|jgi:hypothetical protein|uniref:DUF1816 domain-containing protein n=1 Tax=Synechococcus sp. CBW1107 TaxID=2789857 RepID=UPI0018CD62ED|nr:DUF1816 domain-containing protein [Synechococcus sp. CBW1107]QPN57082.1 DUF1816 domain-containing protein [Synechococcus sp. CBW1107]CAK6694470.1 hypothetical protein BBFGKLBO_01649 [Synechococcus sp. CBW1107]
MNPLIRLLRGMANGLGVAWWARVETQEPHVIYWFGPFVRRGDLEAKLPVFLDDVNSEQPGSIEHELMQVRRGEPLTEDLEPG